MKETKEYTILFEGIIIDNNPAMCMFTNDAGELKHFSTVSITGNHDMIEFSDYKNAEKMSKAQLEQYLKDKEEPDMLFTDVVRYLAENGGGICDVTAKEGGEIKGYEYYIGETRVGV